MFTYQIVSNSSSFEHQHGFQITVGTEFKAGFPCLAEGKVSVEVSTSHSWTWGETETYGQSYQAEFPVTAPPRSTVIAKALVWQQKLDVPYEMVIELGDGEIVKSTGIWKGVSTFNIHYELNQK